MAIDILYTYLAAGIANMAPVFVQRIKLLNTQLDFGMRIRQKRQTKKLRLAEQKWGLLAELVLCFSKYYILLSKIT